MHSGLFCSIIFTKKIKTFCFQHEHTYSYSILNNFKKTPIQWWEKLCSFIAFHMLHFIHLCIQIHTSDSILEIFTLWMKCNEAIIPNVVNLWCAHIQSLPMSCLIPCVPHHNPGRFFIVTSWYLNTVWNSKYFLDSIMNIWE